MTDYPENHPREFVILKTAFERLRGELGKLMAHLTGGKWDQCGGADMLNYPGGIPHKNAGLGLDFVPKEARDTIEALIIQSGMTCIKEDGAAGKKAYFTIAQEGMTAERLALMTVNAMFEYERFCPGSLDLASVVAVLFNAGLYERGHGEQLDATAKLIKKLTLPELTAEHMTRSLETAARTARQNSRVA